MRETETYNLPVDSSSAIDESWDDLTLQSFVLRANPISNRSIEAKLLFLWAGRKVLPFSSTQVKKGHSIRFNFMKLTLKKKRKRKKNHSSTRPLKKAGQETRPRTTDCLLTWLNRLLQRRNSLLYLD